MEKQKNVPPLSTKITRKLTQQSSDYNSLMNFYSSSSRDKLGAPKKRKMSSSLQIDEGFISSSHNGHISTDTTSNSSLANIGERKSRSSLPSSRKWQCGKKVTRSRDGSSSDLYSSHESSLDSQDKIKGDKIGTESKQNKVLKTLLKDKNHNKKSVSSDNLKIFKDSKQLANSENYMLEKDDERQQKHRSPDMAMNGDYDKFKSPDRLTPCNVDVKRRKGRPKATPPTLTAESPISHNIGDGIVNFECGLEEKAVAKQRPLRCSKKKQMKKFTTDKFKGYTQIKKFDGSVLHQYTSKITQNNLYSGFRKLPLFTKIKVIRNPITDVDLTDSVEPEQSISDNNKPDGELSLKSKKIGRPIGSKSKPKLKALFVKAHKNAGLATVSSGTLEMSFLKKTHKTQGVKTKTKVVKKIDTLETVSNGSKENSVASRKDALSKMIEADCTLADKEIRSLNNINNVLDVEIETDEDINQITTVENKNIDKEFVALCDGVIKRGSVDECIDSVLFQAMNETLKPSVRRIKEPLRTKNLKGNGRVKSAGKIKKEMNKTDITKKKKLLDTYAVNTDCIESLAHLASNDLRRKLHSKLILKLSSRILPTQDQGIIKEDKSTAGLDTNGDSFKTVSHSDRIERETHVLEQVLTIGILPRHERNEADDQDNNYVPNKIECDVQEQNINIASKMVDIQNLSALIEQRRVTKSDTEKPFEKRKRGRWSKFGNDQKLMSKSDVDSTCSEFITNSLIKRQAEKKQILVLGEDNVDSDANTVRTRQKFNIVPGRKRKRTLSGEFDLLDEKGLRKEKKKSGKGKEAYKQIETSSFDQALSKHVTRQDSSPKLKVKDGEINKKYASPIITTNRNRLLKQSPFLSKVHKKQFVILKKQNFKIGPQEQANINNIHDCTPQENKQEFFSKPAVNSFKTCDKVLSETHHSETVTHNPVFNAADINSETKDLCIDLVKDDLKETLHIIDKTDINTANVQTADGKGFEFLIDRKSLAVKDVIEVLNSLVNDVVNRVDIVDQKLLDLSNVNSMHEPSIDVPSGLLCEYNVNGRNLKSYTSLPICKNNVLQCKMNLKKARQCRKVSFKHSKSGLEKIQIPTACKKSIAVKRKVKFDANLKIYNDQCIQRKFELRQKISRFPLENLALKQSLKEDEYLKNKAHKTIRKESKLTSKLPMLNIDQEPVKYVSQIPIEDKRSENQLESVIVFETKSNIEKLSQKCTPCSVILNDFIKQLQKAQSKTFREVKPDKSLESYESEKVLSPPLALENVIKSVSGNETLNMTENCHPDLQNCVVMVLGENEVQSQDISESQQISIFQENPDNKAIACDHANVHQQSAEAHESNNVFEKDAVIDELKMQNCGHFERPLEMNADIVLNSVSGYDAQKISKKSFERKTLKNPAKMKRLHNSFIPEQQTARKTVPPLKIKLKGGTSTRRKTYMVELPINPAADSAVAPKYKKKKEKICILQANSEKHGKIHHVRRKRSLPVCMNKTKKDKANRVQHIKQIKRISMQKDSYEANFMHFIQEKEKVKQNLMNFTNNLNTKFKSVTPLADGIPTEIQSNVNVMVNDCEVAETELVNKSVVQTDSNAFTHSHAFSLTDKQNVVNELDQSTAQAHTKTNAVRYVCSQCEHVIFKSEDGIIKHYQTVHTGAEFMYKSMLEDGVVEKLNAIQMHGKSKDLIKDNVNDSPVIHLNAKTEGGDEHYMGYSDDSGSLNLKIVDVVSLKDHVNALNNELPQNLLSRSDYVNTIDIVQRNGVPSTELNIPLYSISGVSSRSHLELQKHLIQQTNLLLPQKKATHSTKLGNTFKCEKCNVHAPLLAAMVAHLRSSHKDIPRLFQCPYCKEIEAETEAHIHLHIKKNHPTDNPNPPVALSETAKQNVKTLYIPLPENYKLSENNLIEKDIYMCLNCRVHMPSHDTIYEHLQQHHNEVFVFVCPYCKLFKSRLEEIVNKHVVSEHQRNLDVNILLAIDGSQFSRIQCLIKEKSRNNQNHQLPSPVPNLVPQTAHLHTHPLGSTQTVSHSNEPSAFSSANSLLQQAVMPTNVTLSYLTNKCTSPQQQKQQQQKKKKNLLESIQQLTMQKQMEQQGLVLSKPTASQLPPNPSEINPTKSVSSVLSSQLMRAPPPYIDYSQQSQISTSPTILFGQSITGTNSITNYSSSSTLPNLSPALTVQRHCALASVSTFSHPQKTHRKIQSSLFDTSDLDAIKCGPKPILNIPVVLKNTNRSHCQQSATLSMSPTNVCKAETGMPLDLSKHSPSQSPITLPVQLPQSADVQLVQQCINPDIFQVFNLRPQNQQTPKPNKSLQGPLPQFFTRPVLMPQQVRQNTPSTLAYRPSGPTIIPTSMPQFFNMPMGTVFGNVLMSLSGIPQGLQVGGPVHSIPTQIVQMNAPPASVHSAVTLISNPQSVQSITTQSLTTQSALAGEF